MTPCPLKIGKMSFSPIVSAPMAGVTDAPFREIIRSFGTHLLYSEMVLSKALVYAHKQTQKMSLCSKEEAPTAVQLEGTEPEIMAEAAKIITANTQACLIDINMGCPVQKVVKKGAGSALMKTPSLAVEIVKAVKESTALPVSVKFRTGWDEENLNYLEFGQQMQEAGADAVTIHARTREQFYSGKADWQAIKRLKASLQIPVIGNGDVRTPEDAKKMLEETNVDGVMIGRGLFGNPTLLAKCSAFLEGKEPILFPKTKDLVLQHFEKMQKYYGQKAIFIARKHIAWYSLGIKEGALFRTRVNQTTDTQELLCLIEDFFTQVNAHE